MFLLYLYFRLYDYHTHNFNIPDMIANIRPELFWFIIGLGLFLMELIIPGFFIFFFGIGAWVTALICIIADPGINLQIIIFAIISVLSLIMIWLFYRRGWRNHVIKLRQNQPSVMFNDAY